MRNYQNLTKLRDKFTLKKYSSINNIGTSPKMIDLVSLFYFFEKRFKIINLYSDINNRNEKFGKLNHLNNINNVYYPENDQINMSQIFIKKSFNSFINTRHERIIDSKFNIISLLFIFYLFLLICYNITQKRKNAHKLKHELIHLSNTDISKSAKDNNKSNSNKVTKHTKIFTLIKLILFVCVYYIINYSELVRKNKNHYQINNGLISIIIYLQNIIIFLLLFKKIIYFILNIIYFLIESFHKYRNEFNIGKIQSDNRLSIKDGLNNKNIIFKISTNIIDHSIKKINKILCYLFFMHIFLNLINKDNCEKIFSKNSYITFKIRGSGNSRILYDGECTYTKPPLPDEIYINGDKQTDIKYYYNFTYEENNVTLMWNNSLKYTGCMFLGSTNIIEFDLSRFDTSEIKSMAEMFRGCSLLVSLDLSNFNTPQLTCLDNMFNGCSSLVSIDLQNINTSNIVGVYNLFSGCSNLKHLNLKNADMNKIFIDQILKSLNDIIISDKYLKDCKSLFNYLINCTKYNELNTTENYFYYTNIKPNETSCYQYCGAGYGQIIYSSNDNSKIYCLYNYKSILDLDINTYKTFYPMTTIYSDFIYATNNIKSYNTENTILTTDYISESSDIFTTQLVDDSIPYSESVNTTNELYSHNNSNITYDIKSDITIYSEDIKTEINSESSKKYVVTSELYFYDYTDLDSNKKKSTNSNVESEVSESQIVYNSLYSQAFDNTNELYSYNNSEFISDSVSDYNEIILESNSESHTENFDIENLNKTNELFFYNDSDYFSDAKEAVNDFSEDIGNKTNDISENKKCWGDLINNKFFCSQNINDINEFVDIIRKYFINELNISYLNEGNDIETEKENILIMITTTINQNNHLDDNKTSIILGECEKKLKNFYNISYKDPLYLFKTEVKLDHLKIPKIEYQVYYPLFNNILFPLNLSICKGEKIDVIIPYILNDDIDKHNPKSDYYNNICSKATSNSGTDISLNDRKNEYVENNMTLCEENCELKNYNNTIKKVKCSCEIKIKFPVINEITFDKNKLYNSFTDIKNIMNVKILKCYKNVFEINSIKKNYGFYIFLLIIILFIITFFLFYCKYYYTLIAQINKIFKAKKSLSKSNNNINSRNYTKRNNKIIEECSLDTKTYKKDYKKKKNKNEFLLSLKKKGVKKKKNIIKKEKEKEKRKKFERNNKIPPSSRKKINSQITLNGIISKNEDQKKILKYNDSELNSFSYEKALKEDKRTYCQYYISLLKTNHLLLFSFYNNSDYNSRIIKIFLFFFFFAMNITINALFFNDDTIHEIYIDEGSFNFIYQIPQIIYSSLISGVINSIIKFTALSEENILKFKRKKNILFLDSHKKKLMKTLKIKFVLFFIFSFFFLTLFFYYIVCFCGIYTNTQLHLIKDTIISFSLSFISPIGISLIPGIFRLSALKAKKKDKKCMYKFSTFLQMI